MVQDPGALSEVIQDQGSLDIHPGDPDILPPAMSQVGIHRFSPGSTQKHSAEQDEAMWVFRQKQISVIRIDRLDDGRQVYDRHETQ